MELGWIHINRNDRNRVYNALKTLGESATLDELGIGKIRDYFSNQFFPGIITNQTRAHYFIILSNLLEDAIDESIASSERLQSWLDERQDKLVEIFYRKYKENNEAFRLGIIGIRNYQQKKQSNQKPLDIYWSGLKKYGIIHDDEDNFFQKLLNYIDQRNEISDFNETCSNGSEDSPYESDSELDRDEFFPPTGCWTSDWEKEIDMKKLSKKEAEFLYQRITESCPDSLLALILKYYYNHKSKIDARRRIVFDCFEEIPREIFADNAEMNQTYNLAIQFQSFYYGCQLTYSYLLSGETDEDVKNEFDNWIENKQEWENVRLEDIYKRANADQATRRFLDKAKKYALENTPESREKFKTLIIDREKELKKARAKIGKSNQNKAVGLLDYRANTAKRIIQDILIGLKQEEIELD